MKHVLGSFTLDYNSSARSTKKPEIAFNKVLRVDLECEELSLRLYAVILQLGNVG